MKISTKRKIKLVPFLLMILMICVSIGALNPGKTAHAITSSWAASYGFEVSDKDYYLSSVREESEKDIKINKGDILGNVSVYAMRARNKKIYDGYYLDVIMMRIDMNPHYNKRGLASHQGLNELAEIKFTLDNDKVYVNHGPKADPPESNSTWSFGVNANSEVSESGVSAGGGFEIGFSTTTYKKAFVISQNRNENIVNIAYDYQPKYVAGTATEKERNVWLKQSHQAFYYFTFKTPINKDYESYSMDFDVAFRHAEFLLGGKSWKGHPCDVMAGSSHTAGRTGTWTFKV